MTMTLETDTELNVGQTTLSLPEAAIEEGQAKPPASRKPEVVENVGFVEWAYVELASPVVVKRTPDDYPRGRQYSVDQETLETLAELPQPPSDTYEE